MIFVDPSEVENIPAGRTKCQVCQDRHASWRLTPRTDDQRWPFCGWCAIYSGQSQWGHENREELASFGELAKAQALKSISKSVEVPELDQHHRLDPDAADRLFMAAVLVGRVFVRGHVGALREALGD